MDKADDLKQPDENATQGRAAERGDVTDADAPTGVEENEGLSTVLSAEPFAGVQADDSEE